MEERTIDAKPVFNFNQKNAKTVKVKLPGLTIPTGKHEINDNDSIMTPVSSPHISQWTNKAVRIMATLFFPGYVS